MDRKTMLDFMIDSRMDTIARLSDYDLEFMKQKIDENKSFDEVMKYIENLKLPIKIKNELSNMVYNLESSISDQFAYFNVKYYKYGFSDAVNIIFDAKELKKEGRN